MSFVHLHNHTHYSLLDGLSKPGDLVRKAKEHGASAVAITDHGSMYGAIDFYKEAKKGGINPILGVEAYLVLDSLKKKDTRNKPFHLVLLAENNEGYQNLLKLTTIAHTEGFYYKPRIDLDVLKTHSKGLIALSACLQGHVAYMARHGRDEEAIEAVKMYQNIFGHENYFLELQYHSEIPDQDLVNKKLIEFSKITNCPLVITNDSHYADSSDAFAHDVLICLQTQKKIDDENRMRYEGDFSLIHPDKIREFFPGMESAMQNTVEIGNRCHVELKFKQDLVPIFQTPDQKTPFEYLKELSKKGLHERYGENPPKEVIDRWEFEHDVIHKMGFDSYFLIVWDFINHAKSKNIVVGPGRGSAAGSIIAYCLKITDLDPLPYGLLFERFLNPERISMPDIDVDFADTRRGEVLDYVTEKYGQSRVAQIITFGTMAARAAVRDCGRVLGYSYAEVDAVAKAIPAGPSKGKKLKDHVIEVPDLKAMMENDYKVKQILETAIKIEGTIRQVGTHACAVIISKEDLNLFCPIQKAVGAEEGLITQFSMKPVEELGLLKMDFLGLRNLSILEKAINIIKKVKNIDIKIDKLPMDDQKTFELFQKGNTTAVFQFESSGMKKYLKDLRSTCFEDLIAMVSLYRPGPLEFIPDYIDRKHGRKEVKYAHKSLEEVLKETYGIAIYQEQILQITQKFAGFTLGQADILRRAIGKKIKEELEAQRIKFIEGAEKLGNGRNLAIEIFDKVIEPFAGYGFNKSHAACYAYISYQTAYMKAHFPAEYMVAVLDSDIGDTEKVAFMVKDCESMGIKVLPPDINQSLKDFTYISDREIRFGLLAVKNVGAAVVDAIIEERKNNGPFTDLSNLVLRVKALNRKALEGLGKAGALDSLIERNLLLENIDYILTMAKQIHKETNCQQSNLFGTSEVKLPSIKLTLTPAVPATKQQRLDWEKLYLGLYVSEHPFSEYETKFKELLWPLSLMEKLKGRSELTVAGMITTIKTIFTKNNDKMGFLRIEDTTGGVEVVIFPRVYQKYQRFLLEDKKILVIGKPSEKDGRISILADEVMELDLLNATKIIEKVKNKSKSLPPKVATPIPASKISSRVLVFLDLAKINANGQLKTILAKYPGETPVFLVLIKGETQKKIATNFSVKFSPELKMEIEKMLGNNTIRLLDAA